MAPLKLHGIPISTCTMRVIATLFEKEVDDFDVEVVDVRKGEHKTPSFLEKQPFGQIPALEDNGFIVFESRAIARYIANKYESQGTDLLGKSLKEKAAVDQWLEVEHSNYDPPISAIVFESLFKPWAGGQTDEERVASQVKKLEHVLDIYESILSNQPYLAGDSFSIADLCHLPYAHYLINVGKQGEAFFSRPHVKAWWEKISSRPAWLKVLEFSQKYF